MALCHHLPLRCHSLIPRDPPSPSWLLHPPSPAPLRPFCRAGRDPWLWLRVPCRDGTLPFVPLSHPRDGICGLVRVTQSRRGTESTVMGARLLHP